MIGAGEDGHVAAGLGDDDLGDVPVDAGIVVGGSTAGGKGAIRTSIRAARASRDGVQPDANSRHPPRSPMDWLSCYLHIRWKLGRYYGYCLKE
jgi:hypothetical protein